MLADLAGWPVTAETWARPPAPVSSAARATRPDRAELQDRTLSEYQQRAINHVASRSFGDPLGHELRVTVNFYPELVVAGSTVLATMVREGMYRNQFETGVTAGDPSAHHGGGRWLWESQVFGGAYDEAPFDQRPKYGSLNFRRRTTGGAPRFGPVHLRLKRETIFRTTFCYPDSAFQPVDFGVASRINLVHVAREAAVSPRRLDEDYIDYIEAHLHGALVLERDVEAIVLDPCYAGTDVERLARDLPCRVEWHGGFTLDARLLPRFQAYREAKYAELGAALARDGQLDAKVIGDALMAGEHDTQTLKRVWHYVAWFGDLDAPIVANAAKGNGDVDEC